MKGKLKGADFSKIRVWLSKNKNQPHGTTSRSPRGTGRLPVCPGTGYCLHHQCVPGPDFQKELSTQLLQEINGN